MKKASACLLGLGTAGLAVLFFLLAVHLKTQYVIFFAGMNDQQWIGILTALVILLFTGYLNLKLMQWNKRVKGRLITLSMALVNAVSLLLCVGCLLVTFSTHSIYYSFCEPGGSHEIIVEEQSHHQGSYGGIYQRMNQAVMVRVGEYSVQKGYRPFTQRYYAITWEEDGFTLRYYTGELGFYKEERVYYQ